MNEKNISIILFYRTDYNLEGEGGVLIVGNAHETSNKKATNLSSLETGSNVPN